MITKHKFWINSRALRFHSCDLELSWIQILLPDLAVSKYLIRSHGARVAPPSHLCRTPGNWTEDYDIFCQSCAYWFWFECSVYLCRADTTEAFIEFCVLHLYLSPIYELPPPPINVCVCVLVRNEEIVRCWLKVWQDKMCRDTNMQTYF